MLIQGSNIHMENAKLGGLSIFMELNSLISQ